MVVSQPPFRVRRPVYDTPCDPDAQLAASSKISKSRWLLARKALAWLQSSENDALACSHSLRLLLKMLFLRNEAPAPKNAHTEASYCSWLGSLSLSIPIATALTVTTTQRIHKSATKSASPQPASQTPEQAPYRSAHSPICLVKSTSLPPHKRYQPSSFTSTTTMSRSSSQSSQNADNFLREKPSTRLHQPPGGSSSVGNLIYGGACDESPFANHPRRSSAGRVKEEAPEQANPYSKDYRRGSNGGGGNDYQHQQQQSSGPYPEYQQHQQQQHQHQQHQAPMQQQYPGYQQQQPYGGGAGRQSSNSYATGSNQNAGNVLTERRITRIHAPPGGKSSITFG